MVEKNEVVKKAIVQHWMDQMYVTLLGDSCGVYKYDATLIDEAMDDIISENDINKEKKNKRVFENG